MNHAQFRQFFYQSLTQYYSQSELMELYHWCMEELHGWNRAAIYAHSHETLSDAQLEAWKPVIQCLRQFEPVQYVFGKAYFRDLVLHVNAATLIPRPETEELVQLVLDFEKAENLSVIDIGTGSGCIPLSLKHERPTWNVKGFDVSDKALEVAAQNAANLKLEVDFQLLNALDEATDFPSCDIVVSNPPYIPQSVASTMEKNVLEHEPHLALFVADNDPFVFFKAIAEKAKAAGAKAVYFETHATEMPELVAVLASIWSGQISTHFDLSGKERFVRLG